MFRTIIREWMNSSTALWVVGSIWILSLIENILIVRFMNMNTNRFTRALTRTWDFLFERAGWVSLLWMVVRAIITAVFAVVVAFNIRNLGWNPVLSVIISFVSMIGILGAGTVSSLAAFMEIS